MGGRYKRNPGKKWLKFLFGTFLICPVLCAYEFAQNGVNPPNFQFVTSTRNSLGAEDLLEGEGDPGRVSNWHGGAHQGTGESRGKTLGVFENRQLDLEPLKESQGHFQYHNNRDVHGGFGRYGEDQGYRGWTGNQLDADAPVWSGSTGGRGEGDDKNGKTFPLPNLPSLDVIEDPGYHHNRPKWPLNEYLVDKFHQYRPGGFFGSRANKTGEESASTNKYKLYEWQKLRPLQNAWSSPRPHPHPHPHPHHLNKDHLSYDRNKYFHLDEADEHEAFRSQRHRLNGNNYNSYGYGYGTYREKQQALSAHSTNVGTATEVKGSESSVPKQGFSSGPYGHVPYFPADYYPKKRFRLTIHPGYIAAPIAGLAAFGAASALTKKPLLFELGLVNNKYHYAPGYGHHRPPIHHPGDGWASNVVPVIPGYPSVNPPIITSGTTGSAPNPVHPILNPQASHHAHQQIHQHQGSSNHLHSHHHQHGHHHHHHKGQHQGQHQGHHQGHQGWGYPQQPQEHDNNKKPWWNPFASLTPRD